jgi:DNA mismatch repair protein MutL
MGTDSREGSAVIELIQQYAVCYPAVRFMMIRNGETVFTTAGDGDALHTIQTLYPDADHAGLIPVSGEHVSGYVSDPGTTKSTRRGQLFFVNGRLVDSKVIEKGLLNGYGGRIFSGHPVAILFIEAEPSEIDVNIHPGKREIKFLKEAEIVSDISAAVNAAMLTRESVPSGLPAKDADNTPSQVISAMDSEAEAFTPVGTAPLHDDRGLKKSGSHAARPYARSSEKPGYTGEQSSIREFLGSIVREKPSAPVQEKAAAVPETAPDILEDTGSKEEIKAFSWMPHVEEPVRQQFSFDGLVYKGYLFDTFIVMQSEDTVYLFDQHAAHERVFYEKFTGNYLSGEKFTQPILTPVTINVSADVYYMSREWLDPLTHAGFDIEDFGADTFVIRGIPSYMELSEAESFARAYLEGLEEHSGRNDTVIDKLIMKSCKSAVKANEKLSQLEIDRLISDLAACSNPYCCPHGRPTFIRYTRYEIERSFRRK